MGSEGRADSRLLLGAAVLGGFGAGCLITLWWQARSGRGEARAASSPAGSAFSTPALTPRTSMASHNSGSVAEGGGSPSSATQLALVVRTDLKLTKARVATQCAHATLSSFKKGHKRKDPKTRAWEEEAAPKVCLRIEGEEELVQLRIAAQSQETSRGEGSPAGLPTVVAVEGGPDSAATMTVLAIGPGDSRLIREVTGHLKRL